MKVLKFVLTAGILGMLVAVAGSATAQQYHVSDEAGFAQASFGLRKNHQKAGCGKDGGDLECGCWEDVSDEKWRSKFGGRIMGDYVLYANQDAGSQARFLDLQNYFEFRRIRFFMSGEGYGVYDYKIQLDFEPEGLEGGSDVAMKDLYVGIHEVPLAGYGRFGHFKAPMSIEELTSSKYITFLERSLPNVFAPGREVGVAAYNNSPDGSIGWAYGVFFDDISETTKQRVNDNQGALAVARVFTSPYYCQDNRYVFHSGASVAYVDDWDNLVRFRSRPETHEEDRFIDSGTFLADDYWIYQTETAIVAGPLSLQGEFFYVDVDAVGAGADPSFYGAYLYGSYFLTGESRNYNRAGGYFGRVKPYSNFWIVNGIHGKCIGPGALELTARWSYLDLSDGVDNSLLGPASGTMNATTAGLNWYLNPYVRWMFNWIHTWNDYNTNLNNAEADILSARLQVDF